MSPSPLLVDPPLAGQADGDQLLVDGGHLGFDLVLGRVVREQQHEQEVAALTVWQDAQERAAGVVGGRNDVDRAAVAVGEDRHVDLGAALSHDPVLPAGADRISERWRPLRKVLGVREVAMDSCRRRGDRDPPGLLLIHKHMHIICCRVSLVK
jgi:hypothetical protein